MRIVHSIRLWSTYIRLWCREVLSIIPALQQAMQDAIEDLDAFHEENGNFTRKIQIFQEENANFTKKIRILRGEYANFTRKIRISRGEYAKQVWCSGGSGRRPNANATSEKRELISK